MRSKEGQENQLTSRQEKMPFSENGAGEKTEPLRFYRTMRTMYLALCEALLHAFDPNKPLEKSMA